jgi:hypothetical protein
MLVKEWKIDGAGRFIQLFSIDIGVPPPFSSYNEVLLMCSLHACFSDPLI